MTWWTALVTCALLVGGVRTAHAQSAVDASREDKIVAAALMVTYRTTFVVQMYDARTTLNAIDAGARERNPLLAAFSSQPAVVVAFGLARATAIDLAVRSIARRNKFAAIAIGAAVNYGYLVIAAHNNSVAGQMRAQQPSRR